MPIRTPALQDQARILSQRIAQLATTPTHQQALDIVAAMQGYKNWAALCKAGAHKSEPAPTKPTSAPDPVICERTVYGFGAGDVLTVRPDLTDEQVEEVLDYCEYNFDAGIGLNWDILTFQSTLAVRPHYVQGQLHVNGTEPIVVTLELHSGRIWQGTKEEVATPRGLRHEPDELHDDSAFLRLQTDTVPLDIPLQGEPDLYGGDAEMLADLAEELRNRGVTMYQALDQ